MNICYAEKKELKNGKDLELICKLVPSCEVGDRVEMDNQEYKVYSKIEVNGIWHVVLEWIRGE